MSSEQSRHNGTWLPPGGAGGGQTFCIYNPDDGRGYYYGGYAGFGYGVAYVGCCVGNIGAACGQNACGQAGGYVQCDGSCSGSAPDYYGSCPIYSSNECGTNVNWGSVYCNGECRGTPPPAPYKPSNYGASCNSGANSCGDNYGTGYIQCNGSCSGGRVPERGGYGAACPIYRANACGTNVSWGTIDCNGNCSGTPPAEPYQPPNYGQACTRTSAPNACGLTATNAGYIQCDGSCSAGTPAVPANPSYYNTTCTLTSTPNACGKTATANGTLDCNGICTGTTPAPPSNATCAPSAPTVSGLYNNTGYLGSSVPAYNASGYQLYAQGTSPAGFNLTYYFEWSKDGVNWTGDPGLPAGSWAVLP